MTVPCNLIKPYTLIVSLDEHDAILLGALPPAPSPVPALFEGVYWASVNAVYWPSANDASPNVNGDAHAIFKRDHEVEHWRVHVLLPVSPAAKRVPPVLPPFVPPAVTDLGLIALHIYQGNSKCRFGPFSVKANITAPGDPVGVINIPWSPVGLFNSESCDSVTLGMAPLDAASPNSVVAGMSLGDYLGCIALIAIDRLTDWLKEHFDGLPDWAKDFLVDPLIDALGEALGEAVSSFLVPAIDIGIGRYADGPIGDALGPAVARTSIDVDAGLAAVTSAFVTGLIKAETEAVLNAPSKALADGVKDALGVDADFVHDAVDVVTPDPVPDAVRRDVETASESLQDATRQRIHDYFGVEDDG